MALTVAKKNELVKKFRINDKDVGSAEVQIAVISERIGILNQHFDSHKKDNNSRRGLLMLVGHRRRLLNYLRRNNANKYQQLITELGIRK